MGRGRFATVRGGEAAYRGAAATADDRHEKILEAAAEVICREGFDRTRIAHIAKAAGVSGGTVIYHFGTLDNVLVEALLHAERRFYKRAEAIVSDQRWAIPSDRVRALVRWVFSPSDGNSQLWTLWMEIWAQAARHPQLAAARVEQDARWRSMLRQIATLSTADRQIIESFAISFGALMDGLTIQIALGDPEVDAESAEAIALGHAAIILGW